MAALVRRPVPVAAGTGVCEPGPGALRLSARGRPAPKPGPNLVADNRRAVVGRRADLADQPVRDTKLKKAFYARLGTPSYWLVDPHGDEPVLTAFTFPGEGYRQEARAAGDEAYHATAPFPVAVVPADLVAGLHP